MSDVRYKIGRIIIWPIESMQSIIAICLILLGLFLLSPWYIPSEAFVESADIATQTALRNGLASALFILPTLSTVIGWFNPRFRTSEWRARGCFMMFVAILFATFLRIMIVGLVPPIWIFYLGMGLVCGVCYLHWKVN